MDRRLATLTAAACAQAGELTLFCSGDQVWCRARPGIFVRETGFNVPMTRRSSDEAFAPFKAEEGQRHSDNWWKRAGDPHLQADQDGLTERYRAGALADIMLIDWRVATYGSSDTHAAPGTR